MAEIGGDDKFFFTPRHLFAPRIASLRSEISWNTGGLSIFRGAIGWTLAHWRRLPPEMLISPERYLQNGIEFLGREKMAAGLNKMLESGVPEEIAKYFRYVIDTWNQGDEKTRNWVEKQLEMAFQKAMEK